MADAQSRNGAAGGSTDPIYCLVYRSRSTVAEGAADTELARIFTVARSNNKSKGITGALLRYEGWFAQALEGPETAVRELFDHIKGDSRHDAVEIKRQGVVASRAFGRWAMAQAPDDGRGDTPLLASRGALAEGAPWKPTQEEEAVLAELRLLTRGYGKDY